MLKNIFHPGRPAVQKFLLWLLRRAVKLLLRFEISHAHRLPAAGPVVVVINHIAWLDPVMAVAGLSRLVIPMAKKEIFGYFLLGALVKAYGAIPVSRSEADLAAIKTALQILKQNGVVLLAPEGTRSPACRLQPGKDGAVLLALRSNAPIVPVGVTGTERVNRGWRQFKRASVHLNVGPPFRLCPPPGGKATRADIEQMTQAMMHRLARQLPPEFRGVYHNPADAPESRLQPDAPHQ
jgi:1-acyl-sn-glycerol-3-phosphate acyltransferase